MVTLFQLYPDLPATVLLVLKTKMGQGPWTSMGHWRGGGGSGEVLAIFCWLVITIVSMIFFNILSPGWWWTMELMLLGLWWSNEPGWIGLCFTFFLLVRRTWVDWIIFYCSDKPVIFCYFLQYLSTAQGNYLPRSDILDRDITWSWSWGNWVTSDCYFPAHRVKRRIWQVGRDTWSLTIGRCRRRWRGWRRGWGWRRWWRRRGRRRALARNTPWTSNQAVVEEILNNLKWKIGRT